MPPKHRPSASPPHKKSAVLNARPEVVRTNVPLPSFIMQSLAHWLNLARTLHSPGRNRKARGRWVDYEIIEGLWQNGLSTWEWKNLGYHIAASDAEIYGSAEQNGLTVRKAQSCNGMRHAADDHKITPRRRAVR